MENIIKHEEFDEFLFKRLGLVDGETYICTFSRENPELIGSKCIFKKDTMDFKFSDKAFLPLHKAITFNWGFNMYFKGAEEELAKITNKKALT